MNIETKIKSGTIRASSFFSKGLTPDSKFWNWIIIDLLNGKLSYSILVYDGSDCIYSSETKEVKPADLIMSIKNELIDLYSREYFIGTKITINIPNGKKKRGSK
jgi:hypothetical protein